MRLHSPLLLSLALAPVPAATAQQPVVLKGATVLDGRGGPAIENAVVVLRDGRIAAVGAPSTAIPRGARVVDVGGKFIVPGFIDMHAHVAMGPVIFETRDGVPAVRMEYDEASSRELTRTLLAFGVTTIRNPTGPTAEAVAMRERVKAGALRGPRIFTAGSVLDATAFAGLGVAAPTEEALRAEIDRQVAAGVDYIKLYAGLRPALIRAGVEHAHRRGKKAIAHLFATSWTDAAKAGVDGIVHIAPGNPALLPAARREPYLRSIKGTQFMLTWFGHLDPGAPEIAEMIAALKEHRVVIDPTLVVFEAMVRGNDSAFTHGSDQAYTPPLLLENWRKEFTLSRGWSEADYAETRALWPKVLAFTRQLYEAGVSLTVGTDLANPWVPPGISFHREMELLVAAGIPPEAVLTMATLKGAEALGIADEVGTIEPGKAADLVVLDADPRVDIRNTRAIDWVVQGGRMDRPTGFLPPRLGGKAR